MSGHTNIVFERLIYEINNVSGSVEIPIFCPNCKNNYSLYNIKRNGHDYSVKSYPQKFSCKTCGKNFYPHTSFLFNEIISNITRFLPELFKNGKINVDMISEVLECSNSSVSRLIYTIMKEVYNSIEIKIAWNERRSSKIIYVDETFIKIERKNYYLVVVVDGDGNVLAWDLIQKRTWENILKIVNEAIDRLEYFPEIIVSDDFSTYKKVVKMLNKDIIHIRHIHKGNRDLIIIDSVKHEDERIVITHIATRYDIFKYNGMIMTKESVTAEKKSSKGKRGRKKGQNNRNRNSNKNKQCPKMKNRKKRGPIDYFKNGTLYLYWYNTDTKLIRPFLNNNYQSAKILNELTKFFADKCITSNIIEQQFSSLKRLVNFNVKRSKNDWKLVLYFYFSIRAFYELVIKTLNNITICRYIARRSNPLLFKLLRYCDKFKSERLYLKLPIST